MTTMGGEDQARLAFADAGACAQKSALQNLTPTRQLSGRLGELAELSFRVQLLERGYVRTFIPTRDVGVDCVVFTTKGWIGVQVKTAERQWTTRGKGAGRRKERLRLNLAERTADYYAAVGVQVFAVYDRGGFFVIPLDVLAAAGQQRRYHLSKTKWWEAWEQVLGAPLAEPEPK